MVILITGGAGFIGTNIALTATLKKHKVIVFDSFIRKGVEDNATILAKNGVEILRADVRNQEDFKRIEKKVDGIIHLAGNPGIPWSIRWPRYDFETNSLGTLNVLEYSRENGKIPVVFASTNKIYSEEINLIPVLEKETRYVWDFDSLKKKTIRPAVLEGVTKKGINEHFPMDSSGRFPHSPYGISKASADLYCQEYYHIYGIPTVINRMSCIYGLYQKGVEDQGWVDWFVRAKKFNAPLNIYGNGKQVRDALFATDIAKLYIAELENIEKVKGEVFNVGGGMYHTTSLLETVDYLNNKEGKPLKLVYKKWRLADQKIYISDISKVEKKLGWKPTTSIHEGLNMMWENS